MRFKLIATIFTVSLLIVATSFGDEKKDEENRQKIRKMATQTLQDLYKLQPPSKAAIHKSAGYAVFNNMGTKILLLSTARGAGIAVDSKTKQETFMKMISAGGGLGVGVTEYNVVFAFENQAALNQFLNSGWSGSAEGDAAAKSGSVELANSREQVFPVTWPQ